MMYQYRQPEFIEKITIRLRQNLNRLELILILTAAVGFFLQKADQKEAGGFVLSLGMVSLASLYFLVSQEEPENKYDLFTMRLTYYSYTIGIIGMLFQIMHWPGGGLTFKLGVVSIAISLIAALILDKLLHKVRVPNSQYIRSLVILLLLFLQLAFPVLQ